MCLVWVLIANNLYTKKNTRKSSPENIDKSNEAHTANEQEVVKKTFISDKDTNVQVSNKM